MWTDLHKITQGPHTFSFHIEPLSHTLLPKYDRTTDPHVPYILLKDGHRA